MRINGIGTLSAVVSALLLAACGGDDGSGNAGVATPVTSTANIQEVVSFGDSLSDIGTYNPTLLDTDKTNDNYAGLPFTTKPGTTWASYLALQYGFFLQPYERVDWGVVGVAGQGRIVKLGGTSYAQGGATVQTEAVNGGKVDGSALGLPAGTTVQLATALSVKAQIDEYLTTHTAFNSHQLILIDGGANDLINFAQKVAADPTQAANATAVVGAAVTGMVTQLGRLQALGATNIVYANVPNLALTPAFSVAAVGAQGNGLAAQLTSNYNNAVAAAIKSNNLNVQVFDVSAMLTNVVAAPASFGLSNVTTPACNSTLNGSLSALPCSSATLVAANADSTYLFADGLHPTNAAHKIWAGLAASQVMAVIPK